MANRNQARVNMRFLALLMTVLGLFCPLLAWSGAQEQALFHSGLNQIFKQLQDKQAGLCLNLDDGRSIEALRVQAQEIVFVQSTDLLKPDRASDVSCTSSVPAQWLTALDNVWQRKPLIAYSHDDFHSFTPEEWRLIFHEAISSLGVVDDEYEVSATLLATYSLAFASNQSLEAIARSKDYSVLFSRLRHVRTRLTAPRFKTDINDWCYRLPKGGGFAIAMAEGGNSTGVGGGGDPESLDLKIELLLRTPAWWAKNNHKKMPQAKYEQFMSKLYELGVEPLDREHNHLVEVSGMNVKFGQSKRTGKLTAYLLIHEIDRGRDQSVSAGLRADAAERIFNYLYKLL